MPKQRAFVRLISTLLVLLSQVLPLSIFASANASQPSCSQRYVQILNVKLSPDGRYVLADWDLGTARLWNVETGELVQTFAYSSAQQVDTAEFSPNGKLVLTTFGALAVLWDIQTGKSIKTFLHADPAENPINGISARFTPDGKNILTASYYRIILWSISSGQKIREYTGALPAYDIGFNWLSADGRHLLLTSEGSTWQVRSVSTGEIEHQFANVSDANFTDDGKWVITDGLTANGDAAIEKWSVSDFKLKAVLRRGESNGWYKITSDGRYLLIVTDVGNSDLPVPLKLLDLDTGKNLHSFSVQSQIFLAQFLPDSKSFIVLEEHSPSNEMYLWNIDAGREQSHFGMTEFVDFQKPFTFLPDKHQVLIGSEFGFINLWDLETGKLLRQFC